MSFDTKYTYNPLPYNIQDKSNNINRQGVLPSYQYKKKKIIWLNTAYATSSVFTPPPDPPEPQIAKFYEFSFNVPPFQLFNRTNLKVISFTSNENSAKPMYIKIKDLSYEADSYWSSDKDGFPILYVSHIGATGMLINNINSLTLLPQYINKITFTINTNFISKNTGFDINTQNGTGHFIMGLLFEDDDLIADNTTSQYK
jgi:hypothetical protein